MPELKELVIEIRNILNNPQWSNALFLEEKKRLSSLQTTEIKNREELKRWLDILENDPNLLRMKLEEKGISIEEFTSILDSDNENFKTMNWYKVIKSTFLESQPNLSETERILLNQNHIPFISLLVPFLRKSKGIVMEQWSKENYDGIVDQEVFIKILFKSLSSNILKIASKTLIYELNKSRISGELVGSTPEERYNYFIESYLKRDEDILNILLKYPVMARLISDSMNSITINFLSALNRFYGDQKELENVMGVKLDKIKDIESMGDFHRQGKSVLKFTFLNENSIIYKPRSLSIDVNFQNLITWFNEKGLPKYLRVAKILNRSSYGWQEFVERNDCTTLEQVKEYYERQGESLAILYMLNATDFHYENIIASGEFPFLVDLESLFHNFVNNFKEYKTSSTTEAVNQLMDSVVRTSLLPVLADDLLFDIDVSGLGGGLSQQVQRHKIVNINTDEMKIIKTSFTTSEGKNLPKYNNQLKTPENYVEEIKRGFLNTYGIILRHREELKSEDGPLTTFANDEVRVILRNTMVYSTLLDASTHPKYLKDGMERERLFTFLWKLAKDLPNRKETIDSECDDLLNGDIPYFSCQINSTTMKGYKDKDLKGVISQDSLSLVHKKLDNLSEKDCEQQVKFIDQSLRTKYYLQKQGTERNLDRKTDPSINYVNNKKIFLEEAIKIGEVLARDAIWGESKKDVTWLGMGMNADETLQYKVMDMGLYNGIMGMALFYGYLAKETNDNKFKEIARACLNTGINEAMVPQVSYVSAFSGYGSSIYVLHQLSKIWNEPELLETAKEYIGILHDNVEKNGNFDLLNGAAGTLIISLDFYESTGYSKALDTAIKSGEILLHSAIKMQTGLGWCLTTKQNSLPLAGLSHGVTGISLSLLKLYHHTNDSRYLNTALEGIKYENSLYNPCENNWMDLRVKQDLKNPEFTSHWCNGAPGIGLGRLKMLEYYQNDEIKRDLKNCIIKTTKDGLNNINYSLCHGDLGNLELLLIAANKLDDSELYTKVYIEASNMLETVRSNNGHWKCGIPGGQQTPNFMVGLSGIGYQLLRLYNTDIPSVIGILEPEH